MPSATKMAGTKRKSDTAKDGVKESKKVKTTYEPKSASKSKSKSKDKPTPKPILKAAKKVEELSDEDSEESDGGVPLNAEDDSDSEDLPKASDGLHPERAKAVVTNSTLNPPQSCFKTQQNTRPILEGSTCEAKAISQGPKSSQATRRRPCPNKEALGTITPQIACSEGRERQTGY